MNDLHSKGVRPGTESPKVRGRLGQGRPQDAQAQPVRFDVREVLRGRLALPVPEVAKLLGISPAAVRTMIHRGTLQGRKIGGGLERVTYIVPTPGLLEWLDGKSESPSAGAA
jgi:hypothetical protein